MNSPMPAPMRVPVHTTGETGETLTIHLDAPTSRAYARLAAATGEPSGVLLARLARASAAPLLCLAASHDGHAAPRHRPMRAALGLILSPACGDVILGEPARCLVAGSVW